MARRKRNAGSTSNSLPVFLRDATSTTGAGLSGITHTTSGLVLEFRRQGSSTWTTVSPLVSKTLGTYASGGIVADGSVGGAYEVDYPDTAYAVGADWVVLRIRGVTNLVEWMEEIELDQPSNFKALAIDGTGRVTVGSNADKTGYSLTQTFPANFASLGIGVTGKITGVVTVDELGATALDANALQDVIANATWNSLTTATWATNSFGKHLLIGNSANRTVAVNVSNHVAANIHQLQPAVIESTHFAAGAIDANALASDAATEIATAVGNLQAISRLDSMIESNGAGQFRFDSIAVSLAGGGGGGGDPWTIDLVTGYSGTQAGAILNSVKSKTDLITSGNVETSLPVTAVGQIASPLVIGDDYLNSNGRAFSWTVALPTGYVVGTSTCKFGMRYEDSQGINSFIVTGTVVDAGAGSVTLRFDVPRITTQDLRPGWYDWSVEIANATSEITPVKSGRNAEWQFKQT